MKIPEIKLPISLTVPQGRVVESLLLASSIVLGGAYALWVHQALPLPAPFAVPFFGHLSHLLRRARDPHKYVSELLWRSQSVKTIALRTFARSVVITRDPAVIKQFMFSRNNEFQKGVALLEVIKPVFGHGIFAANGEEARALRDAAKPLFMANSLNAMMPVMVAQSAERVLPHAGAGEFDMQLLAREYTLATFLELGIGTRLSEEDMEKFAVSFDYLNEATVWRIITYPWYKLMSQKTYYGHRAVCHHYVDQAIEWRKNSDKSSEEIGVDVISRYQALSREELRDQVMNFIIAGRDTTASLIAFASYLFASHPEWQDKVRAELREQGLLTRDADGNFAEVTPDILLKLPKLRDSLRETLRLFPPVSVDGYESIGYTHLDVEDKMVPLVPDTTVWYCSYALHRSEEYFGPKPLTYNPERWLTIRPPSFSFIPFHAGPRTCLGQQLAYLEAKCFFISLFRQGRIVAGKTMPRPAPDGDVGVIPQLLMTVLSVNGGLPVSIEKAN